MSTTEELKSPSTCYDAHRHGHHATRQLLRGDDRPTAIIVGGNQILQGVTVAIKELDLSVPGDVIGRQRFGC